MHVINATQFIHSEPLELPPKKPRRKPRYNPQHADPTPEEIRERCHAIQSEWTPSEERRRRCGPSPTWTVPSVGAGLDMDDE